MNITIKGVVDPNRDDYNVIAESKGGDPNHVVVVDAHLDAIYGAGMLDNASGSATILDIAQMMRKVNPRNKLRFIWFGGEELGELGSKAYINSLSPSELSKIGYDLDADVTATPNYDVGVLDPAAVDFFTRTVSTQFPPQVYEPSKVARDQGIDYFKSIGLNHILFSPVGTDAEQFNLAGIPASGVLTGQDCCKPQSDVDLFGGFSATSKETFRAPTEGASTTRSCGATTSPTTIPTCSRSRRRGSPTWWSRWPSTQRCLARAENQPRRQRSRIRGTPANAAQRAEHVPTRTPRR